MCPENPPPGHVCAPATLSAAREGLGPGGGFSGLWFGARAAPAGVLAPSVPESPPYSPQVGPAPGSMASRGRKRKAEAEVVAAAEKREKPAGDRKRVEEATVVIEHW